MEDKISNSKSILLNVIMTIISLLFYVASLVFLIGPALLSYGLGANKYRYIRHGFSTLHALLSIVIGEALFFLTVFSIGVFTVDFYNKKIYWLSVIISFLISYLLSVFFYFLGVKKANIN